MSIKTMMRVWEHSAMRGAARCLMLALADFANDDGICWPGTASLAGKIRESDDYTETLIKKCIEAGELAHIPGRGRGHKTRFAVLCGLDTKAANHLKGVLQKGYSSTPFTKGGSEYPFSRKRGTTKPLLESGKRGTFSDTKQPSSEAVAPPETSIAENDNHHDPGDHDQYYERSVPSPPSPTRASEKNDGDGDGRTLAFLIDRGVGAAQEFAQLPFDPMRADYEARIADGQTKAIIVKAWRLQPPTETYHYERRRDDAADRPRRSERGKHNGTGGHDLKNPGWMEREFKKLGIEDPSL